MAEPGSIFIAAGDPSADIPGKNLITALKEKCPEIRVFGLGGPQMQKAGLEALCDYQELAVMGFWEVAPKYFFFRDLMHRTVAEIKQRRPQAVVLIDYPGFNLRLAERVKELGIPLVYYISPQVWAWGKGRIEKIRKLVDLMLVIFPFEVDYYSERGVKAVFTGHPVIDRFASFPGKKECRKLFTVDNDETLVGLLPGSRKVEVRRMLREMAGSAEKIRRKNEAVRFVVAGVENIERDYYERILKGRNIAVEFGMTPQLMCAADLIVTASGTATVETAYFGTPMVVIYRTGRVTYEIARRVVKLDAIAMVNIVAGKKVVPELIQDQATSGRIAQEALDILDDRARYDAMVTGLREVREKLGGGDSGLRAADAIVREFNIC